MGRGELYLFLGFRAFFRFKCKIHFKRAKRATSFLKNAIKYPVRSVVFCKCSCNRVSDTSVAKGATAVVEAFLGFVGNENREYNRSRAKGKQRKLLRRQPYVRGRRTWNQPARSQTKQDFPVWKNAPQHFLIRKETHT